METQRTRKLACFFASQTTVRRVLCVLEAVREFHPGLLALFAFGVAAGPWCFVLGFIVHNLEQGPGL